MFNGFGIDLLGTFFKVFLIFCGLVDFGEMYDLPTETNDFHGFVTLFFKMFLTF